MSQCGLHDNLCFKKSKGVFLMKKWLALMLCLIMLVSMAACGSDSASNSSAEGNPGGDASSSDDVTSPLPSETVTLRLVSLSGGDVPDQEIVFDAVNELLLNDLNMQLDITFIDFGSWQQQTNMLLASGDDVDIMLLFGTPLSTYVTNGQVIPLDDLYEQYGQDISTVFAEQYIDCGRINDVLYGITTSRDLANIFGFWMRKDLCDQYGIDPDSLTDLDKLEEALYIIKENEPDIYPVVTSNGGMFEAWGWDYVGDSNNLGVQLLDESTPNIVNLYDTELYKDLAERFRRWYEDGIIMADALNNTESSTALVRSGKAFGAFSHMKPGYAEQQARDTNYEIVTTPAIISAHSKTNNAQNLVWGITNACADPAAAMQFLNYAYTSSALNNLLIYGIEGVHYQFVDGSDTIIDYAEGLDASTTGYPPTMGWAWFNQFAAHVWAPNPEDYWDQMREFNATAVPTPVMGFTFDSSSVKNEVTACTNVVEKYHKALMCGSIDPATALDEFNAELKSAGIDKIIEVKQEQVDEWVAQKNS